MTEKVCENLLGNLEYLMLGAIFVGVLYLVLKDLNVKVSTDGMRSSVGRSNAMRQLYSHPSAAAGPKPPNN